MINIDGDGGAQPQPSMKKKIQRNHCDPLTNPLIKIMRRCGQVRAVDGRAGGAVASVQPSGLRC